MTFKPTSDRLGIINRVLRHIPKISQAPETLPQFDDEDQLQRWIVGERKLRYKSVDWDGNIFLIQNPLVWERNAEGHLVRPKPELKYTYEQAKAAALEGPGDLDGKI